MLKEEDFVFLSSPLANEECEIIIYQKFLIIIYFIIIYYHLLFSFLGSKVALSTTSVLYQKAGSFYMAQIFGRKSVPAFQKITNDEN